jgi:hypothetical protein
MKAISSSPKRGYGEPKNPAYRPILATLVDEPFDVEGWSLRPSVMYREARPNR